MKKILLVLVMIAASVFLAQPAIADEGDPVTTTTTDASGSTEAAADPVPEPAPEPPAPESPPPVESSTPAAAPAPAPAAEAPADSADSGSSDDSGTSDNSSDDQTPTLKKAPPTSSSTVIAAAAADKFWVCKYSGTPGVNEKLKPGQNPISVATDTPVGSYFVDAQGRSYVLAVDDGGPEPSVDECPPPNQVVQVATEDPTVTPPTCTTDGVLTLPTTEGVLYTPDPAYAGLPGTYDVTATPLAGFTLTGTTFWNDLVVGEQLSADDPQCVVVAAPKKVVVCKFVTKPGGILDHIIIVSEESLEGEGFNGTFPFEFGDAHTSVAIRYAADGEQAKDVNIAECSPATPVTAEAPIADPATCDADGTLILPETDNVTYMVEPEFDGPGDYVVTASVTSDEFELVGQTVFPVTVGGKLPTADCVSPKDDEEPAKEDDLLPNTGGLPLWVLLLAGPMTAAGLLILMRREPVSHASTSGRKPSYSLILPPVKKPAGIKRANATTEHIGFMKAVGNVVAAIGSFLRGGRR